MGKKITNEEVEKFYQLYNEGRTCENISKITGHKISTISKYLKEVYNIDPNRKVDIPTLLDLLKEGKSTKEIAKFFNVTPSAISFWKAKYELIIPPFSKEHHELSTIQEQMILGSLLGDMNIGKPRTQHPTCRLAIVHSTKQKELFMKKVEILDEFMGSYRESSYFDKRTNKNYYTIRGNSKSHKIFNDLYDLLYINDVKTITKEYLDRITHPIALAYWFMDDGSYDGTLATNGFTESEVDLLISWLKEKWGIICNKKPYKNKQFTIKIYKESRPNFDQLITPHIIPSMQYKLKYIFPLSV